MLYQKRILNFGLIDQFLDLILDLGPIFQIFYRSQRRNPDVTPLHRAILLDYVRISFPTRFKGKAKPHLISQAYNSSPYSTKTVPKFRSVFDFVYLLFVGNENMEV